MTTSKPMPGMPGFAFPAVHSGRSSQEHTVLDEKGQQVCWITLGVLVALLILSFFDSLYRTGIMWFLPQYQFGFVVPIIGAALIWYRRQAFTTAPMWQRWIGVGLILAGMSLRILGGLISAVYFENVALIPCLLGVFVLVGGLPTLRWAGPAILYLVLMYPFPRAFEKRVMFPLQVLATKASTAALVTMGVDANHDGETAIMLASRPNAMNVAEQCSGLRMLTVFIALAVAFALFATDRPWWERVVIILAAVPISITVNVVRITVTGLLFTLLDGLGWGGGMLETWVHDGAGMFMIALALGLLYVVFQILKHLFIETADEVRPVAVPR